MEDPQTVEREIRKYKGKYCTGTSPLEKAGMISRWFFLWLTPMMDIARRTQTFEQDFHYQLRDRDRVQLGFNRLKKKWLRVISKQNASKIGETGRHIIFTVIKSFWMEIAYSCFLATVISILDYSTTYIIYYSMGRLKAADSYNNPKQLYIDIAILLLGIGGTGVLSTIIVCNMTFYLSISGVRISNSLKCLVYDKMLRKSSEREALFTLGEITNVVQVDCSSFEYLADYGSLLFSIPLETIAGFIGIYLLMGLAIVPAAAVLLLAVGGNYIISKRYKTNKKRYMAAKDTRARVVFEMFENIRFVKLAALESLYIWEVLKRKEQELKYIKNLLIRFVVSTGFNDIGPTLFLISINAFYIFMYGNLSIQKAITTTLILNVFKRNFRFLPDLMVFLIDLQVSSRRISYYLASEEIDLKFITYTDGSKPSEAGRVKDNSVKEYKPESGPLTISVSRRKSSFGDADSINSPKPKFRRKSGDTQKDEFIKAEYEKSHSEVTDDSNIAIKVRNGQFYWKNELLIQKQLALKNQIFKEDKKNAKMSVTYGGDSPVRSSKMSSVLSAGMSELYDPLMEEEEDEIGDFSLINMILKGINIDIKRGSTVAVVGKVGSGKSSFLSALLGEMYHMPGTKVRIERNVAYVAQQSWSLSKTIKDNITMGKPFDQEKFYDALHFSCFIEDLNRMPNRELTVIGNKGVNLSGGQRARLAIARALYSNADLYLFDDPISALDINVGKAVMEKGILNYLKGKTVIVATHAFAFLPYFERILVLEEGMIIHDLTYPELEKTDFFQDYKRSSQAVEVSDQPEEEEVPELKIIKKQSKESKEMADMISVLLKEKVKNDPPKPKLSEEIRRFELMQDKIVEDVMKMEDKAKGGLSWDVIKAYLKMVGYVRLACVSVSRIVLI